jgi:hypothetical protein
MRKRQRFSKPLRLSKTLTRARIECILVGAVRSLKRHRTIFTPLHLIQCSFKTMLNYTIGALWLQKNNSRFCVWGRGNCIRGETPGGTTNVTCLLTHLARTVVSAVVQGRAVPYTTRIYSSAAVTNLFVSNLSPPSSTPRYESFYLDPLRAHSL